MVAIGSILLLEVLMDKPLSVLLYTTMLCSDKTAHQSVLYLWKEVVINYKSYPMQVMC